VFPSAAFAQEPAPSAPASSSREIAEKRVAEWEALAKALDTKIARMLPCDPKAKEGITEVSKASEVRLAALGDVLKGAIVQTKADADRVRLALAAEDASLHETELEHSDSDQERIAIEAQLTELTASAARQPGLEDARKKLAEISASVTKRVNLAAEQLQIRSTLDIALRDMQAALQSRQAALENEQAALDAEASRWKDYYAARLARTQTECSITQAPASRTRKKR
jgi:hypothetical protein